MKEKTSGLKANKIAKAKDASQGMFMLALVMLLLFLSLFNVIFFEIKAESLERRMMGTPQKPTGLASSRLSFCINAPPSWINDCDDEIDEDSEYYCQIGYTDPDGDNVTFNVSFITPIDLFTITPGGVINFTPANNTIGYHTANISIDDGSGCSNSKVDYQWYLEVKDTNQPPYLVKPIPDVNIDRGVKIIIFNLNDYFKDPDNDLLTFTFLQTNPGIAITIMSTGNVEMYSTRCINSTAVFFATDPGNLSANSNPVFINTICSQESAGDEGTQGGGGAGGGGPQCIPNWVCYPWGACLPNGTRSRYCEDIAGCSDKQYWYYEECIYYPEKECIPEWQCGPWSPCLLNNTQTRKCFDINYCDDLTGKPETVQKCQYQPTCFDGVQNGEETGVDCGGPCEPCAILEQPMLLLKEDKTWILLASSILAVLVMLTVMYHTFHEPIRKFLVRLGWLLAGRHFRAVLFERRDAEDLLAKMYYFEKKLRSSAKSDVLKRSLEIAALARLFLEKSLDVHYEVREAELFERLKKLDVKPQKLVSEVFMGIFKQVNQYEFSKQSAVLEELHFLIEELIQLVLTFSPPGVVKYRENKEKSLQSTGAKEIFLKMANIEIALQYEEIAIAKKKFLLLIAESEKLSEEKKSFIYGHMQRINNEITYMQSLISEEGQ